MELKTVGYFREMSHGRSSDPSIYDYIDKGNYDDIDSICGYLDKGVAIIVSPSIVTDVIDETKGIAGNSSAYTDGCWVWPGDLSYYVRGYGLKLPEAFIESIARNNWVNPVQNVDITNMPIVIDGITIQ